jgi:hypothetical protein
MNLGLYSSRKCEENILQREKFRRQAGLTVLEL